MTHHRIARTFAAVTDFLARDLYRVVLLICMALYTWVFAGLAIAQHLGMRTHKADMGQIDQAVWNSSRGRFVEMTDFGFLATRMTDHVEPVLAFISPIYWLWDDPRAILILQTLFVAAGAWILYHLALRHFDATLPPTERNKIWHTDTLASLARPISLGLAVAYLLAPPLQAAVLTEFHAVPLVVPMVLWALWAVAAQRWGQFAAAVFLVATVKEETALLAAGLGIWAIWRMTVMPRLDDTLQPPRSRRPLLLATVLTLLALVWFYVATFVIVPHHAKPVYGIAESGYFARYGALGDSPADILLSFFTQPGLVWEIATEPVRLDYLRRLLMPFGYLSLLAPDVIVLSLPVLLANQLSAYPAQYYGEYHYSAPVFVYFAAAAAVGAARLWRLITYPLRRTSASFQHLPAAPAPLMNLAAAFQNARTALRPLIALAMVVWLVGWGILSYVDAGRGPGGPRLDATPVTAHHQLLPRFTAQIPPAGKVTATAAVHPHVSHRRFVYQFPMGLDAPTPPEHQADWALLNVTMAIDMPPDALRARVEEMLAGEWGVVDAADGFLLLHKGAEQKTIPPDFYTFATPASSLGATLHPVPGPASEASPDPEPNNVERLALQQIGIIDRPYWRATQVVSDWRAGPNFAANADRVATGDTPAPRIAIHAPGGELLHADLNAITPAHTWVPVQEWAPEDAGGDTMLRDITTMRIATLRITTLPHYLPATWGIVAHDAFGGRVVAAYHRGPNDVLHALPIDPRAEVSRGEVPQAGSARTDHADHAATIAETLELSARDSARFHVSRNGEETAIGLRAWIPQTVTLSREVNLFLEWEIEEVAAEWPRDLNVFVHLRKEEDNLAQSDGRPRYFLENSQARLETAPPTHIWDWRQLLLHEEDIADTTLAAAEADAVLQLFVGLYDPNTGARASLLDATGTPIGNELHLGDLRLEPAPLPDQTCALIPDTCAAQP